MPHFENKEVFCPVRSIRYSGGGGGGLTPRNLLHSPVHRLLLRTKRVDLPSLLRTR